MASAGAMRLRRWARRAAFALAPLIALLLIAEAVARWGLAFTPEDHEGAHPRNALGYRDREHTLAKHPGITRVLCVGDSATFGHGLPFEDSYPAALQRGLDEGAPGRWEVILAAEKGWNTEQKTAAFDRALPLAPDVLLYQYELNDIDWNFSVPDPNWVDAIDHVLTTRTRAYPIFKFFFWMDLCRRLGLRNRMVHSLELSYSDDNPQWRATRERLSHIAATCRERGIRPVFLQSEIYTRFYGETDGLYRLLEKARRAGIDAGFTPLSLFQTLDPGPRGDLRVHYTDLHPNARANRIIAGAVADFLLNDAGAEPAPTEKPSAGEIHEP